MKNTFKLFVALFLFVLAVNQSMAQAPTYNLLARNFNLGDTLGGDDNMLKFDINIQWTNAGDAFNYGSCQYCLTYNPLADDGQIWDFDLINTGLPDALKPVNPQANAATSQLRLAGNLPGPIFVVSNIFPGTLVATMRLTTNIPTFPNLSLNARWRNAGAGLIVKISYLDGTGTGIFITDTANHSVDNQSDPLPVELASFTSNVNRNNVTLNWATVTETNNQGFDIERKSINGTDWAKVGYVNGNGTTTETKSYSFIERINTGKYNYRLKQMDFNGNSAYHSLSGEVEVGVPSAYAISQNYPNPFNPTTKIDYDIPFDGKVSVVLYDISGREVGNLVNEVKTAGYYTMSFNGSNLASGMYFYRITANGNNQNFVQTKKMVLVK